MPIRFRLDDRPESVRFALAPAAEAVASLHVLLYPKVHALQHPWIRAMRTVSPALKRDIRAFAFLFDDAFPDCFLPPDGASATFEQQLETVAALSDAQAAYELARPLFFYFEADAGGPERLADPLVRERALAFARTAAGEEGAAVAALAFDEPGALRDRLVGLLARYWDEAFAAEWHRLEPQLRAGAVEGRRVVSERGPFELLETLPGLLREGDAVVRRSPHEHTVEVGPARPLTLIPSAYVWPHVRVNCDPPWPIAVLYPAPFVLREAARAPVPPELVRLLRAVGDETRLRILKLVADRPRTTEELATLVHLSEPALSRQLRNLAEAGVLRTRRDGYYVLYSLEREVLAGLAPALGEFLSAPRGESPRSGSP